MRDSLLGILVDPRTRSALSAEVQRRDAAGEILQGQLRSADAPGFEIRNGIPRFVETRDEGQKQTADSFGFKWQKQAGYDDEKILETHRAWVVERYGFSDVGQMRLHLGKDQRVLDAGCGSGLTAATWLTPDWRASEKSEFIGMDISAAVDVARDRLGVIPGLQFVQGDLCAPPFAEGSFDVVFSEGVLHHTPSTELAFKSLVPLLRAGGEFMFYVYRKKGPIREFSDDYIRRLIVDKDPAEAWDLLLPLTKLAKALSELEVEVEVPEDIPYLGIKAGRQDVQRLIYWNMLKLFWNPSFSLELNNHTNFDWYHPAYAHRQTEPEIRSWCESAGLAIEHFDEQESGFTVRAVKRG